MTSPVVINVPTRALLAGETKGSFVQWLANLNIKRNFISTFEEQTPSLLLNSGLFFIPIVGSDEGAIFGALITNASGNVQKEGAFGRLTYV